MKPPAIRPTDAAAPVLGSRFQPIVHIDDAVWRERLTSRALTSPPSSARLTLVVAPAGFGKTTMLAQLASRLQGGGTKVAWLNCDARDGHADVFAEDLIDAILASGLRFGPDTHRTAHVAQRIASINEPAAIFIDEYEVASTTAVDDILDAIATSLPENVAVVVGSREVPNVQLTQLQLAGRVRLVEADTLRFNYEETRTLLQDHLPEKAVSQVAAYADGWPFALQLARLRAANGTMEEWAVDARVRLPRRQIFDYLAEEVLATLDKNTLAFLAEVAVLEVIEIPAANAIRVRNDSLVFIKRLLSLKPIVVVDESRWSARLHPLLRDYLLDSLESQTPGKSVSLHVLAARHFAGQQMVYEAVGHAVRGGRPDLAAEMIEKAGALLLLVDQGGQRARLLLQQLPAATLKNYPRLRLLQLGQKALDDNDMAPTREFARLERIIADEDERAQLELEFARSLTLMHEAEYGMLCDPWPLFARLNELARMHFAEEPRFLGFSFATEIFFLHRYGPVERSERRTRETEVVYSNAGFKYNSPWLLMYRARNAFAKGELANSEQILARSISQDINFITYRQNMLGQLVSVLLGRICLQRREFHEALAHFTSVVTARPVALLEIHTAYADIALCEFELGNHDRAIEVLHTARQHAFEEKLVHLGLVAGAREVELEARRGRVSEASKVASEMELETCWGTACQPLALPWLDVSSLARASFSLHAALGDFPRALQTADEYLRLSVFTGHRLSEMSALAMRARALHALRESKEAGEALEQALKMGHASQALQPFVSLGAEFVQQLRDREPGDSCAAEWAARVVRTWEGTFRARSDASGVFTRRELDVLCALPSGLTTKEIARTLVLSPETVKHHLKSIFAKLGVSNRDEAVAEARRRTLVA